MKSQPNGTDQDILASDGNSRRDDGRGGSFLLAHQQLGALSLATAPTNGQTVSFVINGTTITAKAVATVSAANDIYNPGTAAGFVENLISWLRRPDLTNSNQVAASFADQQLLQYVGWAWPGSSTNIVPFSLNKNVNGITGGTTSFNITTTVTSGSWTADTMQLYVENGVYFIGSTRVIFNGGSTPTVTAPTSNPRIDVLSIDSSGALAWTIGTESATPSAPSYPNGKLSICELYNVVSETALYDNENQQSGEGYISNDVRPILGGTFISSQSQIASGIVIFDPGSDAQGDILYFNGSAWARLPAGTAGQLLQTGGASANPSWTNAFGAKLAQTNTQASGSLPQNTDTTVQTLSSIVAIGANSSIRIRGHYNGGTNSITSKLHVAGVSFQIATSSGATDNYFEATIVNLGSQTTNIIYGFTLAGTTLTAFSGTLNATLSSAWTLSLSLNPPAIASSYTCKFLDVYVFG